MNTKQLIKEVNEGCVLAKIERKEIIELLEEGEGYKNMWEELYKQYGSEFIRDWDILKCIMNPIKQKYFPEEGK